MGGAQEVELSRPGELRASGLELRVADSIGGSAIEESCGLTASAAMLSGPVYVRDFDGEELPLTRTQQARRWGWGSHHGDVERVPQPGRPANPSAVATRVNPVVTRLIRNRNLRRGVGASRTVGPTLQSTRPPDCRSKVNRDRTEIVGFVDRRRGSAPLREVQRFGTTKGDVLGQQSIRPWPERTDPSTRGSATLERFDVVRGAAVALSQVTGRKRAMTTPSQASRRQYESIGDAAGRLGVSTKTVRRWIASGQLAGYRVGPRLLRVDPDDLDRMLRLIPAARAI